MHPGNTYAQYRLSQLYIGFNVLFYVPSAELLEAGAQF